MKYDFYDDISLLNNFMPYDSSNNVKNDNNFNNEMLDFENLNNFNTPNNFNQMSGNNLDLYSPYEGYMRGNAFKDQYVPYKNYQPQRININSEQDEMLVNIGQYSFMAHEMNLLLDTQPNNREALDKFQEYRDRAMELTKNYERKYGPLTVNGNVNQNTPFNWVTTRWPWVR